MRAVVMQAAAVRPALKSRRAEESARRGRHNNFPGPMAGTFPRRRTDIADRVPRVLTSLRDVPNNARNRLNCPGTPRIVALGVRVEPHPRRFHILYLHTQKLHSTPTISPKTNIKYLLGKNWGLFTSRAIERKQRRQREALFATDTFFYVCV